MDIKNEHVSSLTKLKSEIESGLEADLLTLDTVQERIRTARERLHHIDGLLGTHSSAGTGRSELPPATPTPEIDFLDACEAAMSAPPSGIHVDELREKLVSDGVPIPGKGTTANIIGRLRLDPERFRRTDRGTYGPGGVMAYQDYTLKINGREDRRLTDGQLVEEWHKEFPKAKHLNKQDAKGVYTYVKDIRRCYNQGKEGHGERDDTGQIVGHSKTLSEPYDQDGNKCTQDYGPRWLQACKQARR
jgi:hypothetical protein